MGKSTAMPNLAVSKEIIAHVAASMQGKLDSAKIKAVTNYLQDQDGTSTSTPATCAITCVNNVYNLSLNILCTTTSFNGVLTAPGTSGGSMSVIGYLTTQDLQGVYDNTASINVVVVPVGDPSNTPSALQIVFLDNSSNVLGFYQGFGYGGLGTISCPGGGSW